MKVSVIIVNHNGKKYLPRLIQSFLKQDFKSFEMIMVDNGSVDDSIGFVSKEFPAVRIVPSVNNGFGMACNEGAKTAKGDFVMFFNEDMYVPKDFISQMVSWYDKRKNKKRIGGVGCKIIPFDSDPAKTPSYYGGRLDLFGYPSDIQNQKTPFVINGCPFFIKRRLFLEMGGFNPNIFLYGDDSDLSWRLKLCGYHCFINNETYAYHLGGAITGGLEPQKVAYLLYGSFIAVLTNYQIVSLIMLFPFLILYYTVLHVALWIYMKGKFKYNIQLLSQTGHIIIQWRSIMEVRHFVQRKRTKTDLQVLKNFTIIPSIILNYYYKQVVRM